jgi:hypothetical protein
MLDGVIKFKRIPLQNRSFDAERRHSADGRCRLGCNGRTRCEAFRNDAIEPTIELHFGPPEPHKCRKSSEDDDYTKLPSIHYAQDRAGCDVKHGNEDEANIEAHEFEDSLWVGIDATGQSANVVLRAVEIFEVLTEDVAEDLLAEFVCQSLIGGVSII